jgi:hypothetical protein
MAVVAVALAALGWLAGRRGADAGPVEYDVGLPDTAAMWTGFTGPGFALAPSGDFVIYQAAPNGRSELWYRPLRGRLGPADSRHGGSERADPLTRWHARRLPQDRPSFATAPGGGFIYLQGAIERPAAYLRVVPHWVDRMKQAVDEANR